ncbi:MAG: SDR family oxidoreductase [Saprospiraceae bacterium]
MKTLIAGSTGQLGYAIVRKLSATPHQVVALHRPSSDISALKQVQGISLVKGDLLDPASLSKALEGIDVVISTANAAVPTNKRDTFKNDVLGHRNLIEAAEKAGVKQFIFTSVISFGPYDHSVPLSRAKRQTEADLASSGIPFTIFQPPAFMDIYLAFFGTELPLQGAVVSSINRPYKFMNSFYNGIRKNIETKGLIGIIGKGGQPSSFIAVDNVADFHIKAIGNPAALNRIIPIGGPEALTAMDVKELFEELYGKTLKVKSTPPLILGIMSRILSLFDVNASNILAMQYAGSKVSGEVPNARATADEFGVRLISAKEFLLSCKNAG